MADMKAFREQDPEEEFLERMEELHNEPDYDDCEEYEEEGIMEGEEFIPEDCDMSIYED
jgi:hypothetical protein